MKALLIFSRYLIYAGAIILIFAGAAQALPTPVAGNYPSSRSKENITGDTVIAECDGDQVTFHFQRIVFHVAAEKGEQKTMTADISYSRGKFLLSLFANVRVDGCPECAITNELILKDSYIVHDRAGELKLTHFLEFSSEYSEVHFSKTTNTVFVFGTPSLDGWDHNGNKRREKGFIDVYRNSILADTSSYYLSFSIYDLSTKVLRLLKYEEAVRTQLWSRPSLGFVGAVIYDNNIVITKDTSGLFIVQPDGTSETITGQGAVLDPTNPFVQRHNDFASNENINVESARGYKICVSELNKAYPTCSFYKPETKELTNEIKDVYQFTYEHYFSEPRPTEMHAIQRGPNNTVRAVCTEAFQPVSASPYSQPLSDEMMDDILHSGSPPSPLSSYKNGKHGVELVEGSGYDKKVLVYLECTEPLTQLLTGL